MSAPSNSDAETTPSRAVVVSDACSALADALALVEFGPCRDAARPQDWMAVASPMCQHCEGTEDVNFAAARIIAAEYRNVLEILKDPVAVHINMLRGTIAWTPEHLRHVLGDSSQNTKIEDA
jgi:hypothetical protein